MGRKKDPNKPARILLPVRFAGSAIAMFDALAAEHGMTRSAVVRQLVARGWQSLKPGEKP